MLLPILGEQCNPPGHLWRIAQCVPTQVLVNSMRPRREAVWNCQLPSLLRRWQSTSVQG